MTFTVAVPATSANLGPGFDALGVALALYNRFHFSVLSSGTSESVASGEGADVLNQPQSGCLVIEAARFAAARIGGNLPPIFVHIESQIPVQRGLGSSASAVVAGVVAANLLLDARLTPDGLMSLAAMLEGHADNVAPAIRGGFQTAIFDGKTARSLRIPVHPIAQDALRLVVCCPDFKLSTGSARSALPDSIPHADAAFNVGRATLLTTALCTGSLDLLRIAFEDRLHQPYRAPLIPGFDLVIEHALRAGAFGACLSGSGSTMLALAPTEAAPIVGAAMQWAFRDAGVNARWFSLTIDEGGTNVQTYSRHPLK